jgi:hypothetical protein
MEGMSQTLYIIVAAIVILVTAVVIVSMFVLGVQPAVGIAQAGSLCQTQLATSCSTFGQNPATWNVQNIQVKNSAGTVSTKSCAQLVTGCTCNPDTKKIDGTCTVKQQ